MISPQPLQSADSTPLLAGVPSTSSITCSLVASIEYVLVNGVLRISTDILSGRFGCHYLANRVEMIPESPESCASTSCSMGASDVGSNSWPSWVYLLLPLV